MAAVPSRRSLQERIAGVDTLPPAAGGSSSGRTADSDSASLGSNPSPPAKHSAGLGPQPRPGGAFAFPAEAALDLRPLWWRSGAMRLLLVEDNAELADWLARLLRRDNYAVD